MTSRGAAAAPSRAWVPLAALLSVAGVAHLVRPDVFAGLVPRWLGPPQPWVYVSGVAELACAAGLVAAPSRRLAGWASAALFVAVFPGNVTMAVRALESDLAGTAYTVATLARLPLQLPLVWWAVRVAQRSGTPTAGGAATMGP